MILSIGEILADMVGERVNGVTTFKAFCGGAPFNLAVNAKQTGAKAAFVSCVGSDPIGRFVVSQAEKAKLEHLDIQVDEVRNTTIAFVTLTDGERDFAFYRHDTADFNIDFDKIDFNKYEDLTIIHLGSLMLSETKGKMLAKKVADKARNLGVLLSFDMNFRMDIYRNFEDAKKAYTPFVECADIIKFSEDELFAYTGISDMDEAAKVIFKKDRILLVTLGKHGSAYYYNDLHGIVPTVEEVKRVDTTGAGDAFFGAFLAAIENKRFVKENIENALAVGNLIGGRTTEFMGAIKL